MKATKIASSESEPMLIASLPTRPTAPSAFGGKGYTATEMKAAFDKLPLFIIEHYNNLIDDIQNGSICESIPTGIDSAKTLSALLQAFADGTVASIITYRDTTLTAYLESIRSDLDRIISTTGSEANSEQ